MIYVLMAVVFVLGYAAIAFEHNIKIDKSASALLAAGICWALYSVLITHGGDHGGVEHFEHELSHHISEIGAILFFLLGAMTIVELIDSHNGLEVITSRIKTTDKRTLLWVVTIITFFLSSLLDNLTTAIVMTTLVTKLMKAREDQLLFGGFVIIAANAGGAFSPIGDVTTTMLWMGGQLTTNYMIPHLFLPSVACVMVPLMLATFFVKGKIETPDSVYHGTEEYEVTPTERNVIFGLGIFSLLMVPVYKAVFHLPPYVGIMIGLSTLWIMTEIFHHHKEHHQKKRLSVTGVLERIDTPTIFFFLGILLVVASLQSAGHLSQMAGLLDTAFGDSKLFPLNTIIGLLSAIVDNVPLVAAVKAMYPLTQTPTDDPFWALMAYCAGTGGSCLIIGSAAGVATMSILKIDFMWYVKNISLYALAGYFAGILVFWVQSLMF